MTDQNTDIIQQRANRLLDEWLVSCTTAGRPLSRNTVAMGIVVLDHLRRQCPVFRSDVISARGEVANSRSGLRRVLERYGIPERYLKECTTRQSHQDGQRLFEAYEWGSMFCDMNNAERDAMLIGMIGRLSDLAFAWLNRQSLRLDVDRRQAPSSWVAEILESARNNQSGGVVEQHLVVAKLERRFADQEIPNQPAHAGDQQTDRPGDFAIARLVYHVTASPGRAVIQKCARNIQVGQHPILLVPREQVTKARALAEDENIAESMTITSIEDFVALNIIELATEEKRSFFDILREIIEIYNRRLGEVETDLSLQIEVR